MYCQGQCIIKLLNLNAFHSYLKTRTEFEQFWFMENTSASTAFNAF